MMHDGRALAFRDRWAHAVSVWFGVGYFPKMPGTAGSLAAVPLFYALHAIGPAAPPVAALFLTGLGIWAADVTARRLGIRDPSIVCVDEVTGMLLALLPSDAQTVRVVTAFVLFRILDQWKPGPVRALERLPGGLGIMLDDVAAGLFAAFLTWLIFVGSRLAW